MFMTHLSFEVQTIMDRPWEMTSKGLMISFQNKIHLMESVYFQAPLLLWLWFFFSDLHWGLSRLLHGLAFSPLLSYCWPLIDIFSCDITHSVSVAWRTEMIQSLTGDKYALWIVDVFALFEVTPTGNKLYHCVLAQGEIRKTMCFSYWSLCSVILQCKWLSTSIIIELLKHFNIYF